MYGSEGFHSIFLEIFAFGEDVLVSQLNTTVRSFGSLDFDGLVRCGQF